LRRLDGLDVGRPVEGWTHERIEEEIGEISYYVNDRVGRPLIVPDDDISGTFTFLRALEDSGAGSDIEAAAIGHA